MGKGEGNGDGEGAKIRDGSDTEDRVTDMGLQHYYPDNGVAVNGAIDRAMETVL